MKNTIKILTLAIIALTSCKKETINTTSNSYKVSFTGTLSTTFHCYINNNEVKPVTTYDVKKGDVLKIVDEGTDIYHSPTPDFYPFNGPVIKGKPGYTEQGYTSGTILLFINGNQTYAPSYGGYGDTNLTYTIK